MLDKCSTMKNIKVIQRSKVLKTNGTSPIYFQYSYNRTTRTLLNTGKSVEPSFWDSDHGKVKRSHQQANQINSYINTLKIRLEAIIDDCKLAKQDPTIDFVKEKFTTDILCNDPKSNGFYEALDKFIITAGSRLSKGVVSDYGTLKRYLQQFENYCGTQVSFFNITKPAFYDDFIEYLKTEIKNSKGTKGLKINSVWKYAKNLKCFLNNCMRRSIISHVDLSFMKKISEKTFSVYLNDKELEKLTQLDLNKKPEAGIIRDLFIIGAETGLRFSDYSRLDKHHIKESFIRIPTLKTQDLVVIPISTRLRAVLEKYEDHSVFQITNQYFNREIKQIMKIAGFNDQIVIPTKKGTKTIEVKNPKWELISSHTCRRSFCTNQFLKGVPSLLIRKISGHKTEKAFLEYIKIDEEAAAIEMMKIWNQINLKVA